MTMQPPSGQPGYPPPAFPQPGFVPPPGYQPGFAPGFPPPGFAPNGITQLTRPGSVTAAAIMWIIYGGFGLLGNLMGLAASGGRTGGSSVVGLGIAVAFLITGIQALGGKARGLLGSGIASIVLGALVAIALIALGGIAHDFHKIAGLLVVLGLLFGGFLVTAGVLACVGNTRYKAWRASRGLY
jgi:hypothetical protein